MNRWFCSLAVTSLFILPALGGDPSSLEERIAPIAKAHKGKIAVAVKGLRTTDEYYLNADEPMPTASLIKLAVMVDTYWQADEGKVSLDKTLTLKKEDKVPGSGILTYNFSDGTTFPLRDAVRLMMVYSDNTATNMVLDQIGLPSTNERMEKLGLKETKINAKVFRADTRISQERGKKYGLGSTTAREAIRLLEMIERHEVASPAACDKMIELLKANDDKDKMTRFLPPGTVVGHKTGSLDAAKTDAGIVYYRDPADKKKLKPLFALCVLTDDNEDKRWVADNAAQITIGKIAKAAYDHFTEGVKK